MLACMMCGGILETGGAAAIVAASMIGAEVYNRARRFQFNRNRQAARVARIIAGDKLAASLPHNLAARRIVATAARLSDRRELAAELAAS